MISTRYPKKTEGVPPEEVMPFAVPIEMIGSVWKPVQDRLQEENLIQQLKPFFTIATGGWFTEVSFENSYESLPFHERPKYRELGENRPEAFLEWVRKQGDGKVYELIDWIKVHRKDIYSQLSLPDRINFVNRNTERQDACRKDAAQYMLFDAPAGYGKTELLKALEQQHFRDGWYCIYIQVKQGSSALDLVYLIADYTKNEDIREVDGIEEASKFLAINIRKELKQNIPNYPLNVLFLFDNLEFLPEEEITAFLNIFLPAVQKVIPNVRVRMAGRYVSEIWVGQAKKIPLPLTPYPLSPFQFQYVRDTVKPLFSDKNETTLNRLVP